jgi:hypothetical protein
MGFALLLAGLGFGVLSFTALAPGTAREPARAGATTPATA